MLYREVLSFSSWPWTILWGTNAGREADIQGTDLISYFLQLSRANSSSETHFVAWRSPFVARSTAFVTTDDTIHSANVTL